MSLLCKGKIFSLESEKIFYPWQYLEDEKEFESGLLSNSSI